MLLLIAACTAPSLPSVGPQSVRAATAQVLGPHDVIAITVLGHPELSTGSGTTASGLPIGADGTLQMPLIGTITLMGLTPAQARDRLARAYGDFLRTPDISVTVLEWRSPRFHLLGMVTRPGPVTLDRPLTALEALSHGGGVALGGDRESVAVMRPFGDRIEVFLFNAQTPGPAGWRLIQSGDILFVRQSGVGRFSEEIQPYLQAFGMTAGQISTALLALDRLAD